MSDLRKIRESKLEEREPKTLARRQILALEDMADAIEGIRQDLAGLVQMLPTLMQTPK